MEICLEAMGSVGSPLPVEGLGELPYLTDGHRIMELGPRVRSLCLGAWQTGLPSLAELSAGSPGFKPSSTRKQSVFHSPTYHS